MLESDSFPCVLESVRQSMPRRRGGMPAIEIAHGETITALGEQAWNWSTAAGQMRLARRVELFLHELELNRTPGKVVELGCGTGLYTERLAPFCRELVAVDISDALLAQARARVPGRNVTFVRQNLERIEPHCTGVGFDAAFGCSVLHHLDLDETLPQLRGILAPGARLAFSEPNLLNPQVRLMFSGLNWAKRRWAVSDTEMAFYPWELRSTFTRYGFRVLRVFPFDFMHPAIGKRLLPFARGVERWLERTPLLRQLAGSCFILACRD